MLRIIEQQFRHPSGFLGKIISRLMQKTYAKAYNNIIDLLEIKNHDTIFEIGYGHGLGIEKILAKYDCFISGIDYSKLMNKIALKRNQNSIKKGQVELLSGDFLEYEMSPKTFNKVYCLNVIYFWNKLEIPFSKIKMGLKDDGFFCFYMDHPDELKRQGFMKEDLFNKYTIDLVIAKLKTAGFNKIDYTQDKMGYYVKCKV